MYVYICVCVYIYIVGVMTPQKGAFLTFIIDGVTAKLTPPPLMLL